MYVIKQKESAQQQNTTLYGHIKCIHESVLYKCFTKAELRFIIIVLGFNQGFKHSNANVISKCIGYLFKQHKYLHVPTDAIRT